MHCSAALLWGGFLTSSGRWLATARPSRMHKGTLVIPCRLSRVLAAKLFTA
jgi:hypothetical protein